MNTPRFPAGLLAALLALASFALRAQTQPTAAEVADVIDPADSLERALVWRIDVPGAPAPSYLFGTIHLIDAADFELSDSLMSALNRVDRVVFEIDPAEMTDMGVQMQMFQKAMMRGDTTLTTLLTDEEYARVSTHFSAMGLPMMLLDKIKPMFLSMLAALDPADLQGMMGAGDDADGEGIKSYEMELSAIADASEKEVGGLESTDFQMSLFDSIPYTAQAKMLMRAIDSTGTQGDQLAEITEVYVSGDIEGMYAMSVGDEGGLGGFERMLLVNRNRNWIAPMTEQAAAGPTLFAVGAGHLGGPEGVIRLLRAEGVALTPVSVR